MLETGLETVEIDEALEKKLDVPTTTLKCVNEDIAQRLAEHGYITLADIQSEPDTDSFAKNAEIHVRRARQIRFALLTYIEELNGTRRTLKNVKSEADAIFDFSRIETNDD